jgi:uncharacterized C2H2 Zn-finger protein
MADGYLKCPHCAVEFLGTASQIKHHKYEGRTAYCSDICRKTAMSNRMRKPMPTHGPCPTCGNMFESRTSKIYCSQTCYSASPAFEKMREENILKAIKASAKSLEEFRELNTINCLECSAPFYQPPAKKRRFCSNLCSRSYMAKRFDRWVASPERIALPQNFDEFLTQTELPCLVEGCGWVGKSLSGHMNQAHGVPASEFKRAAGFNLGTGVVSADLSAAMSLRPQVGVALAGLEWTPPTNPQTRGYISLEAREHRRKARLMCEGGPIRPCKGCGKDFQQSTVYGKAQFCSRECRDFAYGTENAKRQFPMECGNCKAAFLGNYYQSLGRAKGRPVACSISCRNTIVGGYKKRRINSARQQGASSAPTANKTRA